MKLKLSPARLLQMLMGLGAILALWHVFAADFGHSGINAIELVIFAAIACAMASRQIALPTARWEDEALGVATVSLGFVAAFAAMLRDGLLPGVVVGALAAAAGCYWPIRRPCCTAIYNVSLAIVEMTAASHVFFWVSGGDWVLRAAVQLPAAVAAGVTMYAINGAGRSVRIAAARGASISTLWKQDFLWIAPAYVGLTCMTALPLLRHANFAYGLIALTAPFCFLTYHSLHSYANHARERTRHVDELQNQQAQLEELYLATIKSLALAIDAKDQYTHQHILRVQRFAVAIAEKMGISPIEMEAVRTGALLHDIGKLGVPEHLLLKPGKLTEDEYAKVKKHPVIGASILDPVDFPWPVLPAVRHHHERWDGTGYPSGLKEHEIPMTARILAVADVYDALTSNRSYRDAWTHRAAVAEIKRSAGSHFDPQVVKAFLAVIDGVVEEMAAEGHGPLAPSGPKDKQLSAQAKQAVADIRQASSELWELYEIAQSLTAGLGTRATLDILAPKLEVLLPDTGCAVLLADPENDWLVVHAAVGFNREFFQGCHTYNLVSTSAVVARTGRAYVGRYCPDDLLLKSEEGKEWVKLRSALILPLKHQGEIIGTLNIYRCNSDAFSGDDVRMAETIAQRTASALYNGILYERAQTSASTDPLTGLHNVRYLTEHVENRCAAARARIEQEGSAGEGDVRDGDRFALLCIDLDSFKPINDNFGHQKGDQVLRDLARLFKGAVREGDIVSRYGGDEFLIVLDGADSEVAAAMAARIQQAVEQYDPALTHEKFGALHVGASVGYACFPADGLTCTELLATADAGMYSRKTERKLQKLANPDELRDLPRAA